MLVKGATGENALPFRSLDKHIGHTVPLCVEFFLVLYVARQFMSIDLSHKSQNASVPYPTMQHFITEMCTCVHISVIKCCIVGYLSDAFWDLWDVSILNRVKIKRISGFWMHVKYFDICTSSFNADKVRNLDDDISVLECFVGIDHLVFQ